MNLGMDIFAAVMDPEYMPLPTETMWVISTCHDKELPQRIYRDVRPYIQPITDKSPQWDSENRIEFILNLPDFYCYGAVFRGCKVTSRDGRVVWFVFLFRKTLIQSKKISVDCPKCWWRCRACNNSGYITKKRHGFHWRYFWWRYLRSIRYPDLRNYRRFCVFFLKEVMSFCSNKEKVA